MAEEFDIVRANLLPVAGTVTDNDMLIIAQGGKVKRALPSAMKGPKGDSVKGDPGDSAYIDWKKQPGNGSKTYAEYQAWLRQPATDAAAEVRKDMVQISQDANLAIRDTNTAKDNANAAAGNANNEASNLEGLKVTVTNASYLAEQNAGEAERQAAEAEKQAAEAKIQADYAQEQGDKAAELNARVVNLENGKYDGYEVEDGIIYMLVNGQRVDDGQPVGSGSGGGGSAGVSMKVIPLTPTLVSAIQDAELRIGYTFTSVYADDQSPTGDGTAIYTVNSQKVATVAIKQGDTYYDISKHLTVGTNIVKVNVKDVTNQSRTLTFTVEIISLSITSSYDPALVNSSPVAFRYIPFGAISKTVHFVLDGTEIATYDTDLSNRQLTQTIPAQSHGAHLLNVYMTAVVNSIEIESNHLYYDLVCIEAGNNTPVVASAFQGATVRQSDTVVIPFFVYKPGTLQADVVLSIDGNTVSERKVDRTMQSWNYRTNAEGIKALKIACGDVYKEFSVTVNKLEIDVSAETQDLKLYLTSQGRSNSDKDREVWKHGDISAQLEGMNWNTNGWVPDESGNSCLRVGSGAKVTIPLKPFASDIRAGGKTIEIDFKVRDVYRYDTPVFSCWSGGRGIQITSQSAKIASEQSKIETMFKDEERIRAAFVVEKRADNRLLSIYINGIKSQTTQYPDTDNFMQSPAVDLVFGGVDATIDIYNIRSYDNNLNRYQLLNNYIADMDDVDRKVALYNRNQIYDSYGKIDFEKVNQGIATITIIGDLSQYKGDKKVVTVVYTDYLDPSKSWTGYNIKIDIQGTSSQYYPRKNYKLTLTEGIVFTESGETAEMIQITGDVLPAKVFCIKTDFAESSGTHNTGVANMADWMLKEMGFLTEAQKEIPEARTTVAGHPAVLFHKATSDSQPTFVGKINFNTDKGAENTFGFKAGDESWEFLNNTSDMALFKSSDFTKWQETIEARYPDGGADTTNVKKVFDWVVSCKGNPSKFKAEYAQYFSKDMLVFYALTTFVLGMTDQRAKNMFLTRYRGKLWLFILYDNDTLIPINNEGLIALLYNVETRDIVNGANVWNGANSELWKLVEEAFADEMREMYFTMRQRNILSYDRMIDYLYNRQAGKWCEAVYNEDGYYKYEQPLTEGYLDYSQSHENPQVVKTGAYLYALQGSREMYGKWIWKNRFLYLDSKFLAGSILGDTAVFRTYTPVEWSGVEPCADITLTAFNAMYFNVKWGSVTKSQRVGFNETFKMIAPADMQFNDTETIIYGASLIASLGDLSPLYPGTVDVAKMIRLKELIVGSTVAGYRNKNLHSLYIGTNRMMKLLNVANCPNYTEPINVLGCENMEELYAQGSGTTAVLLPEAGIMRMMHLPETITNLKIKNQSRLTDETLILDGIGNISTINLENVIFNAFDLLTRCLSLESVALTRIRCINSTGSAATPDILYQIAGIGGIDENGYNIDRAVLTGNFHVSTIREDKFAELGELFPELTITYDTLTLLPAVTLSFTSSQNKPLLVTKFASSSYFKKIDNTTFQVKGEINETFTFTFSALNHEDKTGEITITQQEESKEYSATYIPLRTIKVLKRNTSIFIPGATVKIGDETFTASATGQVQIRKNVSLSGTVEATDYNDSEFSFDAIVGDTTNEVYLDACAVVTFTVKDEDNKVMSNVTVSVGGKKATTNSFGICTITLKKGTYTYSANYDIYNSKAEITVGLSNISVNVTMSQDVLLLKPEPNGNIQFLMTTKDSSIPGNKQVSFTFEQKDYEQGCTIYWGDGSSDRINAYRYYYHTYENEGLYNIEIDNTTNIISWEQGSARYLVAMWDIGSVKSVRVNQQPDLIYVGDIFKNDIDRRNLDAIFWDTPKLQYADFSSVSKMTKVTIMSRAFCNCGLRGYLEKLSHFTEVSVVSEMLSRNNFETIDLTPISGWVKVYSASKFLYACSSLITIDLSPISGWTNVENFEDFVSNCSMLTSLDATPLSNLLKLKNVAFQGLDKVRYLKFGWVIPPLSNSSNLYYTGSGPIYVPDESVELYKTATGWTRPPIRFKPMSDFEIDFPNEV